MSNEDGGEADSQMAGLDICVRHRCLGVEESDGVPGKSELVMSALRKRLFAGLIPGRLNPPSVVVNLVADLTSSGPRPFKTAVITVRR